MDLIEAAETFPSTALYTTSLEEFKQHWAYVLHCCQEGIPMHIIEKHYCKNASELVLNNRHPSIKVIAAKPPFLNIYKEWEDNIIIEVYGKRHLSFICPLCGLHS